MKRGVGGIECLCKNNGLCSVCLRFRREPKHKKTRQEKIIADLRRKLTSVQQPATETLLNPRKDASIVKKMSPLAQTISYTSSVNMAKPSQFPNREVVSPPINYFDYSYVYRDLRKTLVLTLLAIGFELVLYWQWR